MKALIWIAIGCAVVAAPFVGVYCKHVQEDREVEENSRRYQIESNTPGTKAYEAAQTEKRRRTQLATEAARPAMVLPPVRPLELVGKAKEVVRGLLGVGVVRDGDLDAAGAVKVGYVKGRAVKVIVRPANYSRRRDEAKLRAWAGFPATPDDDTAKVGARTVVIVPDDIGATISDITDELRGLNTKRRKTFAEFVQRTWRADGTDVNVSTRGAENQVLQIEWVGCSNAQLESFVNGSLFERNKYEFTRAECNNGYSTSSIDWR